MLAGYFAVKVKFLKEDDSRSISLMMLYIIIPCTILNAFQIDKTPERTAGLGLALAAGIVTILVCLLLSALCGKLMKLSLVEQATVMYSNAGNMIIPIIVAMLGREWVIYSCAYISVINIFFWTHLVSLFTGKLQMQPKKLLTNPNLIAVALGIFTYFAQIKLPGLLGETVASFGNMVGPLSMIITGMLLAGMKLGRIFINPKIWLVALIRLALVPLCLIPFMLLLSRITSLPSRNIILMIVYLAGIAPGASTVVQFAQICDKDAGYASALNVMTVLLCVFTMPLFTGLFTMLLPVS